MPQFLSPEEAVAHIKDGDCVIVNSFLSVLNAEQLSIALNRRFRETGSPKHLTIYCPAGLGGWDPHSESEEIVCMGAVDTLICSHFGSMPATAQMILDDQLEAYNLPYGVMSHAIRAAAGGQSYVISDVGLNLFVDPRYKGYQLNERSRRELVREIWIDGRRRLQYDTPQPDVALLKASSCDAAGNITMEDEPMCGDALAVAQAVHRRGGTVIVQVKRKSDKPRRPIEVIIPAVLVDYICICPEQEQIQGYSEDNPRLSGGHPMTDEELYAFVRDSAAGDKDLARLLTARRAARELKSGHVVNIGVGVPELVGVEAARDGLLPKITLTVEAGSMKGLPVGGRAFGATMAPQFICTTAQQFDFYDGGGLDICFIGALEIDAEGNVNGHYNPRKLSGIGGFINITQFTRKVVFCTTFSAGGLEVAETEEGLKIVREGRYVKFVEKATALSFSALNAHENGQEVLYVTERCVFRLGEKGLVLTDVARGIDVERDILRLLPFPVEVAEDLKVY